MVQKAAPVEYGGEKRNRDDAIERFVILLRRAAVRPKIRRMTKPSNASKRLRLDTKRRRGAVKKLRQRPSE